MVKSEGLNSTFARNYFPIIKNFKDFYFERFLNKTHVHVEVK